MRDLNERRLLAGYGIHLSNDAVYAQDEWRGDIVAAVTALPGSTPEMRAFAQSVASMGFDAQPGTITAANVGVPAIFTNIVDPEVVRVLTQPMQAVAILGETKKGNWTTLTAQFPFAEPSGQVASYGDYNNNGTTDAQMNWIARQSYHYQTIKRAGERQIAMWGAASVNYMTELDMSAALVMAKFYNRSGFYGIANLANYGLLNDPSLIAPSTPATKAAGGTTWVNATAVEIYEDVRALFKQLNAQMGYNLKMTDAMRLVLSSNRMPDLDKVSAFNVPAIDTIKRAFPNLEIVTAPEYTTGGGELMQLILPSYNGIRTGYIGFTEKMRAHPLIAALSSWMQKQSGGTWGAIIRRPIAIAQMLGV